MSLQPVPNSQNQSVPRNFLSSFYSASRQPQLSLPAAIAQQVLQTQTATREQPSSSSPSYTPLSAFTRSAQNMQQPQTEAAAIFALTLQTAVETTSRNVGDIAHASGFQLGAAEAARELSLEHQAFVFQTRERMTHIDRLFTAFDEHLAARNEIQQLQFDSLSKSVQQTFVSLAKTIQQKDAEITKLQSTIRTFKIVAASVGAALSGVALFFRIKGGNSVTINNNN